MNTYSLSRVLKKKHGVLSCPAGQVLAQGPRFNNYLNTGYEPKPCEQTEGETYTQPDIFNLLPENEENYLNGLNLLIFSQKDSSLELFTLISLAR